MKLRIKKAERLPPWELGRTLPITGCDSSIQKLIKEGWKLVLRSNSRTLGPLMERTLYLYSPFKSNDAYKIGVGAYFIYDFDMDIVYLKQNYAIQNIGWEIPPSMTFDEFAQNSTKYLIMIRKANELYMQERYALGEPRVQ